MAIDSPNRDFRIVSTTQTSVTMNAGSGWQSLQTTGSFTTTVIGPIIVHWQAMHGYEQGATNMSAKAIVKYSNNAQAAVSDIYQVQKQGLGSNYAFGSHNFFWIFYNMPVHAGYTVEMQGNNEGNAGTQHISNYFGPNINRGDKLIVSYQA
tara:strand:+ start:75 stop:527 length:453 start_codon:yes stop_codon:yes gene_type:complete